MLLEHGWTKTNNVDIIPPPFNDHLKGRRHEKRRKCEFEIQKPRATSRMDTITCSNYKI
jgi:hypothetical protein